MGKRKNMHTLQISAITSLCTRSRKKRNESKKGKKLAPPGESIFFEETFQYSMQ